MKKIALFLAVVLLLAGCAAPASTGSTEATVELPTLSGGGKEGITAPTRADDGRPSLSTPTEPEYPIQDAVLMVAEVTGQNGRKATLGEAKQFALPADNAEFKYSSGSLRFSAAADGDTFVVLSLQTEHCYVQTHSLKKSVSELKLYAGETFYLIIGSGEDEVICALWLENGK